MTERHSHKETQLSFSPRQGHSHDGVNSTKIKFENYTEDDLTPIISIISKASAASSENFDSDSSSQVISGTIIAENFLGDPNYEDLFKADQREFAINTIILNGAITDVATTLTVEGNMDSDFGWPESGYVKIDDEIIYYQSRTDTTLDDLIRGRYQTTAAAHSDDDVVTFISKHGFYGSNDGQPELFLGTITDTFTRADSAVTLGATSQFELSWQVDTGKGTWGISTNRAYLAVDSSGSHPNFAVFPNLLENYRATVTLGAYVLNCGIAFDYVDLTSGLTGDMSYKKIVITGASQLTMSDHYDDGLGGDYTNTVATFTTPDAIGSGDTITIDRTSAAVQVYFNGTLLSDGAVDTFEYSSAIPAVVPDLTTTGGLGPCLYTDNGAGATTMFWNDITVEETQQTPGDFSTPNENANAYKNDHALAYIVNSSGGTDNNIDSRIISVQGGAGYRLSFDYNLGPTTTSVVPIVHFFGKEGSNGVDDFLMSYVCERYDTTNPTYPPSGGDVYEFYTSMFESVPAHQKAHYAKIEFQGQDAGQYIISNCKFSEMPNFFGGTFSTRGGGFGNSNEGVIIGPPDDETHGVEFDTLTVTVPESSGVSVNASSVDELMGPSIIRFYGGEYVQGSTLTYTRPGKLGVARSTVNEIFPIVIASPQLAYGGISMTEWSGSNSGTGGTMPSAIRHTADTHVFFDEDGSSSGQYIKIIDGYRISTKSSGNALALNDASATGAVTVHDRPTAPILDISGVFDGNAAPTLGGTTSDQLYMQGGIATVPENTTVWDLVYATEGATAFNTATIAFVALVDDATPGKQYIVTDGANSDKHFARFRVYDDTGALHTGDITVSWIAIGY